jgi:hypothetical protein
LAEVHQAQPLAVGKPLVRFQVLTDQQLYWSGPQVAVYVQAVLLELERAVTAVTAAILAAVVLTIWAAEAQADIRVTAAQELGFQVFQQRLVAAVLAGVAVEARVQEVAAASGFTAPDQVALLAPDQAVAAADQAVKLAEMVATGQAISRGAGALMAAEAVELSAVAVAAH